VIGYLILGEGFTFEAALKLATSARYTAKEYYEPRRKFDE
jgi:hypothetical protein